MFDGNSEQPQRRKPSIFPDVRLFTKYSTRLATNLYSTDTRLVYELVQNADDNQYTLALFKGERPFLAFEVFTDRIVIDSNEDGFTEANVRAICSTGESTKSLMQGYIEEKGIGFKSVFKAAQKVHIQSGLFSFAFSHSRSADEDGLGMVTPKPKDYGVLPASVRTRMVLSLLPTLSLEEIVANFANISNTLLLFLSKLEEIRIKIHAANGTTNDVRLSYPRNQNITSLTKLYKQAGDSPGECTRYHVFKKDVQDLPHDDARKHTSNATIVLAFPVNGFDAPVIEIKAYSVFYLCEELGLP